MNKKNECMNMEETNKVLDRIQSDLETLLARMKKKETVTEKLFKYSPSLAKNLERMEGGEE